MECVDQQSESGVTVDVDQNPHLAEGATTVDAIVSIAVGSGAAANKAPRRLEALIVDCSTSMSSKGKFDEARRATKAAVDEILDGTLFAIVAGTEEARPVYPVDGQPVRADETTKAAAAHAVDNLTPGGGTAMGAWLAHVRTMARQHPDALTHAILLTDGKDEHETREELDEQIVLSRGGFTCDCRGVGTDWQVNELRAISSALLGSVDIVADPADLADDFAAMIRMSMCRTIRDLTLRLWIPVGARVAFLKQVSPTVEDLTHRVDQTGRNGEYPLGPWGTEERDYHLQVEIEPAGVGREKLVARVSVVEGDQVLGQGLVKAKWTSDTGLSAPISRRVAHYTGQAELAQAVQDGLAARKTGDIETATATLHRAWQLAVESGNTGTAALLRGVIELDEHTGTARLRRAVADADEMALDARSTRTARVRKEA